MSFQLNVECRRGRHKCHPTIAHGIPWKVNDMRPVYKVLAKLDSGAPGSFRRLWKRIRAAFGADRLYLVTITYHPAEGGQEARLSSIALTFKVPKDFVYKPRKKEFNKLKIAKVTEWYGSDGKKRVTIKIVPKRR